MHRVVQRLGSIVLVAALSGCAAIADQLATERCDAIAAEQGEGYSVSGVFVTDVAGLRSLTPFPGDPPIFDGLAEDEPAVLCWIDGFVPRAPPPGPGGEVESVDRAAIGVVGMRQELILAGYRDRVEVRSP